MKRALIEGLIRQTDSYGHLHLTPTEAGCTDPSISYCPFCGRGVNQYLREIQDREQAVLARHYKTQPE
jgi:hypothetical protein